MWRHIAEKFDGHPALFGYDVMNEPFLGTDGGKVFFKLIANLAGTTVADGRINKNSASYTAGYNANGDIIHTINIYVTRTVNDPSNSIYQYVNVKLTDENGTVLFNQNLPDSWWQNASSLTGSIKK